MLKKRREIKLRMSPNYIKKLDEDTEEVQLLRSSGENNVFIKEDDQLEHKNSKSYKILVEDRGNVPTRSEETLLDLDWTFNPAVGNSEKHMIHETNIKQSGNTI
jgi:hypothetical protein